MAKWRELDDETRAMASQTLLTLGTLLYEWGVPLEKALHGIRCAYEVAERPVPCKCRDPRDKELCKRKDECAEVRAFAVSVTPNVNSTDRARYVPKT